MYYVGLAQMLELPEFQKQKALQSIIDILENYAKLHDLFEKNKSERDIRVLIGEETGFDEFTKFAIMFTPINLYSNHEGYLALIGPNRMKYAQIIPVFRNISNTIESVVQGW